MATISEIFPESPTELLSDIHLTIDADWCEDTVLAETIEIVEGYGVSATWFLTHDTFLLPRLLNNPKFEIGIHPNFSRQLAGGASESAESELRRMLEIFPNSKSIRSHSIVSSSPLSKLFAEHGLTHESNYFIPFSDAFMVRPWTETCGLIQVPFCWADDASLIFGSDGFGRSFFASPSLKVLDFHPIHIYLNTESMEHYESTRADHRNPVRLRNARFGGRGIRTVFLELLDHLTS